VSISMHWTSLAAEDPFVTVGTGADERHKIVTLPADPFCRRHPPSTMPASPTPDNPATPPGPGVNDPKVLAAAFRAAKATLLHLTPVGFRALFHRLAPCNSDSRIRRFGAGLTSVPNRAAPCGGFGVADICKPQVSLRCPRRTRRF